MNFLQYADGKNDLKKISELIKISYKKTFKIYNILTKYIYFKGDVSGIGHRENPTCKLLM